MADLKTTIANFLNRFVAPLEEATHSEYAMQSFLGEQGFHIEAIDTSVIQQFQQAANSIIDSIRALSAGGSSPSLDQVLQWIQSARSAVQGIENLGDQMRALADASGSAATIAEDLLDYLLVEYLRSDHPSVFSAMWLLTLIESAKDGTPLLNTNIRIRTPVERPHFRPARLKTLLSDPAATLRGAYLGADGLKTSASALAVADNLFPRIAGLIDSFGGSCRYASAQVPDSPNRGALLINIPLGDAGAMTGAVVSLSADDADALGLVVAPFGATDVEFSLGDWDFDVNAALQLRGFALGKAGLQVPPGTAVSNIDVGVVATRATPDARPAFLFGSDKSTRFEIGETSLKAEIHAAATTVDYGFEWSGKKCAIVLQAGEGDGFLAKILPSNGVRADFDLTLGWATDRGLYLGGNAGIETTIPLHLDIGGLLTVESIYLAIAASDKGLGINLGVTASAQIGPIAASVKRIGLKTDTQFPGKGGNLGFADMSLGFLPPTGAGLSLDTGAIVGAGYLERFPATGEYGGIVNLAFSELAIIGQGLIKPSAKDFSMVIIVSVTFSPPIQLSFGFTLSGVGGLVAVNRTINVEYLRDGLKTGALESLLFPTDPIANGPTILATMGTAFPTKQGRYVFGPIVRIGWGTPNLIIADIGIMIEVPEPIRLVLIGQISALLPKPDDAIVELHIDVLGVLDFEAKSLAIDATIYKSKILTYTLSGDAALRWLWGANAQFALSLGGFHPKFTPPPNFPSLRRLTLNLIDRSNLQLDCKVYQALTSNTLQFGAAAELYASCSSASVEGGVSFDALIQIAPFHFDVDINGHVSAKAYGHTVASVKVSASLSGPTPWNVNGKASFHVLRWDPSVHFHHSWGREDDADVPRIDPLPPLLDALQLAEAWGAQFPENERPVEMIKAPTPSADGDPQNKPVIMHPASDLQLLQSVLPLDFTLDRFGSGKPMGHNRVSIKELRVGGAARETTPVLGKFARAQFEDMSDADKVSRASFEDLTQGVEIKPGVKAGPDTPAYTIEYEQKITLADGSTPKSNGSKPGLGKHHPNDLKVIMDRIAWRRIRILPPGSRFGSGDPRVTVASAKYGVVDPKTLKPTSGFKDPLPFGPARSAVRATAGAATMIPSFEMKT